MPTFTYTETLTAVQCVCGISYAIPDTLNRQMLMHRGPRGKQAYCPLGHTWHYTGKSEAQEERERRERAERREQATRDLLVAEEHSHRATKGHLTRQKRRVANGVCPCCNRSFKDLARHMAGQHPDYGK